MIKPLSFRTLLLWAALAVGLVLINVALTFTNTRTLKDDSTWVTHSHQVIAGLEKVLALTTEAETGVRGYILARDAAYLEPYREAIRTIDTKVDEIHELTKDNATLHGLFIELRERLSGRLGLLEQAINAFESGGIDAINRLLADRAGMNSMEALRATVKKMSANEQSILANRKSDSETMYAIALISGFGTGLAALVAVAAFIGLLLRHQHASNVSNAVIAKQAEQLRVTLESIGDAVISTDRSGMVSFMNPIAEKLTGWNTGSAQGVPLETVFRIINESTRAPVENPANRALRDGAIIGLANHTVLIAKDGAEYNIDDSAAPIRDQRGDVIGAVLVFRDISARQAAERALRETEERFRSMADAAPVLIWKSDPDKLCTWFNATWLQFVGRSMEQEVGAGWMQNVHPDDYDRCSRVYNESFDERQAFTMDYRMKRHDGEYRWIVNHATPRYEGETLPANFAGYIGSCVDITDRKQTEAALQESESRFRTAVGIVSSLIWTNDGDGKMVDEQPGWATFTGQSHREYQGYGWTSAVHPEDVKGTLEAWKRAVATKSNFCFEHRVRRHDGQWRLFNVRAAPVLGAGGAVAEWVGVHTDITDQQQTELRREQLLISERAARTEAERAGWLKDEFLATLSHELRTPLTAILGWTHILLEKPLAAQTVGQGLAVIDRNARLQAKLIADLLDMSRIISGKMRLEVQQVDFQAVIGAAVESVRPSIEAKGIRIQSIVEPIRETVNGDPARLQQIVWNLLSNAVKFTPRGERIQIVLAAINSHIQLSVEDTGQGISAEFLPHIFQRFRQADSSAARTHGGLGLGLSIVRQLVELHGGSIRAESGGEGKGATFTVQFPISAVAQGPAEPPSNHPRSSALLPIPSDSADLTGVCLLVVDDDQDSRDLIVRLLEDRQATVVVASSADEALQSLSGSQFDAIISDIGMPVKDGYAFIRETRLRGCDTPAIALTAFARSEDRTRALRAGFQTHISKPVEPSELFATIQSVLSG